MWEFAKLVKPEEKKKKKKYFEQTSTFCMSFFFFNACVMHVNRLMIKHSFCINWYKLALKKVWVSHVFNYQEEVGDGASTPF